ncbi:NAD(P)-binding protein [Amniculicola lignicola CBS 123094]|uniref:NAD(P)-binding protein n=1 Tax=Amniculicola lignicola CBS 123094 TaxID=1392246 RepID=A0A6A5WF99_9PLEO|nr:NAD(P)-binding protein [Amniculicola lignicola CBS 123094]
MADQQTLDPDMFTKQALFTKSWHRDLYPAIDPKQFTSAVSDKVVLVTGASRNLGKYMVRSWAEAGASGIVITSRRLSDLAPVVQNLKEISPKTEVLAVAAEMTKEEDVKNLFEKIKEKFGRLDVVVANAGVVGAGSSFPRIGDISFGPEKWWGDLENNVRTAYLTAHYYITTFGPEPVGTFITMASAVGRVIMPGNSSYGISKSSTQRLVPYLHAEYPSLRAFSLDPGIVAKHDNLLEAFRPFAFDMPELSGAWTVWLSSSETSEVLRGGYVQVNWDVEELEKHKEEIGEKKLNHLGFINAHLGPEGHAWEN